MSKKLFQPRKFKKVDFSWYFFPSIGLGISFSKWNIAIELPFIILEASYFTKQELEDMKRVADYFSENAILLDK